MNKLERKRKVSVKMLWRYAPWLDCSLVRAPREQEVVENNNDAWLVASSNCRSHETQEVQHDTRKCPCESLEAK